jgi:hypothetical protein
MMSRRCEEGKKKNDWICNIVNSHIIKSSSLATGGRGKTRSIRERKAATAIYASLEKLVIINQHAKLFWCVCWCCWYCLTRLMKCNRNEIIENIMNFLTLFLHIEPHELGMWGLLLCCFHLSAIFASFDLWKHAWSKNKFEL